jgi:hypothetical protein
MVVSIKKRKDFIEFWIPVADRNMEYKGVLKNFWMESITK